tara:strand:+ start:1232 stop:1690 length:459 start_codon:yes stop_codon:yes gene_type:complete
MDELLLIKHAKGSPGLRLFGLGPRFKPSRGINKLQKLLNEHTFWAINRNKSQLRKMLLKSSVAISVWKNQKLVGFGRGTSDEIFRAVLWDVVISNDHQGSGLGRILVDALLNSSEIKNVEKVYLMTTNCVEFYKQIGFEISNQQKLLILRKN